MSTAAGNLACNWCGMIHQNTVCPRAKAIDYYQDGTVKRVEFWEMPSVPVGVVDVDALLRNAPK